MTSSNLLVTDSDIPPTDPAPKAKRTKASNPTTGRVIAGDSLLPTVTNDDARYLYSVGLLPSAPGGISHVDVHGVHFPKIVEVGVTAVRREVYGSQAALTAADVERLAQALKGRVFRRLSAKSPEKYTSIVRIPTADECALRLKNGFSAVTDSARPTDEPVANYVWCRLIRDPSTFRQFNPGDELPQPVSVTGLELPDENTKVWIQ